MVDIKIMSYNCGNFFNSTCKVLVNPVNCAGLMGKGLALEFKNRFGNAYFRDYQQKCRSGEIKPGTPYYYKIPDSNKGILNFPTKDHWKDESKIEYIESGLDWIISNYQRYYITSIALPALGCGSGGLRWRDVAPLIAQKLSDLPIYVELYSSIDTKPWERDEEFLYPEEESYNAEVTHYGDLIGDIRYWGWPDKSEDGCYTFGPHNCLFYFKLKPPTENEKDWRSSIVYSSKTGKRGFSEEVLYSGSMEECLDHTKRFYIMAKLKPFKKPDDK